MAFRRTDRGKTSGKMMVHKDEEHIQTPDYCRPAEDGV
jgi:hypothetical protein